MTLRSRISAQLRLPVPPPNTPEWRHWQDQWRAIGEPAAPTLIAVLERGTEAEQYSALLALRLFGNDVWGEGYGPALIYRLTAPGSGQARVIKPSITPEA